MNLKNKATGIGGMRNSMPRIICRGCHKVATLAMLLALTLIAASAATAQERAAPVKQPPREQVEVLFNPHRRCILSAEVSSSVTAMPLEEGNRFKAGEVLVRLDNAIYTAALEKARARMQAAQKDLDLLDNDIATANVEKARARLKSAAIHKLTKESLFKDKTVSLNEVEDARAAERVARADLAIAQAQLKSRKKEVAKAKAILAMARADMVAAREQVAGCTIKAPFAGRVVKRYVNAHERVQAGQKLIEILDDSILEAQFFMPSRMLNQVRLGTRISITVRETSGKVQGTITRVGAEVNPVTSTITVYAEVVNPAPPSQQLRGGMRGSLDLSLLKNKTKKPEAAGAVRPEN